MQRQKQRQRGRGVEAEEEAQTETGAGERYKDQVIRHKASKLDASGSRDADGGVCGVLGVVLREGKTRMRVENNIIESKRQSTILFANSTLEYKIIDNHRQP